MAQVWWRSLFYDWLYEDVRTVWFTWPLPAGGAKWSWIISHEKCNQSLHSNFSPCWMILNRLAILDGIHTSSDGQPLTSETHDFWVIWLSMSKIPAVNHIWYFYAKFDNFGFSHFWIHTLMVFYFQFLFKQIKHDWKKAGMLEPKVSGIESRFLFQQ